MAVNDSERKQTRPPLPSQGAMALLGRWVSDLERETPRSALSPQERPQSEVRLPEPTAEQTRALAIRAARAELRLEGLVVTFPPGDAQVVLGREGGQLIHRGTVSVRGPCAPTRADLLGIGLTEAQARALEFVLAWFAASFDTVTWESPGAEGLRWGAWPLSGIALIEVLARWKRRDPAAFEARLGRLGINATLGESTAPPSLTLLDLERGKPVGGRHALTLIGEDMKMFAALAQAGRERSAQLAQLEYVLEQILRPTLASAGGNTSLLDPSRGAFSTPRALALLFHAELRFGRRGVERLVAHTREEAGQPGSGERAGQLFAADLHAAGRAREAAEVRRILTSPELVSGAGMVTRLS